MDPNININAIKTESTERFPCPSCGANMVFNPEAQALTCPYCKTTVDITVEREEIREYDFESAEDTAPRDWGNEKRVIHCDSCGAESLLDINSTAQFCPFCGSSHIVKNDMSAGIAPESLIPFKVSQEMASNQFKAWIKKRFFAPRALKTNYHVQKITGTYIPCWTYDSSTYSTYSGEGGTYYYVTETHWVEENGKKKMVTRQVRKIRWWPTSGTYSEFFNDVLVNASRQIDENLMESLSPFDLSELKHYKPQFLSGFLAERYSIGLKEGWQRALEFIKAKIRTGVIRKINADEVRNLVINTYYNDIKYKHILLPVWISAYSYKNKVYRYMVNGQTGEVQGHAPVSPWKVTILVLLGLLVLGGVLWYVSRNQ